jgi:DNA-directed RNA polymerase I, II, and III subunit RPABC1
MHLVEDRGYTQIKHIYHGNDPILLLSCRDSKGDLTFCYLSHESKVGVRTLRKMRSDVVTSGGSHMILLSLEGLTPFANKERNEMDNNSVDIEIFCKRDLCMPVIHHCLVPPHTALTRAQKAQLLTELRCKPGQLPKLKESDPVARYLHLTPGTVVRIVRRIGSMEAEPYFRIVV